MNVFIQKAPHGAFYILSYLWYIWGIIGVS